MCGRYTVSKAEQLPLRFGVENEDVELTSRFNVAPSQLIPVVVEGPQGRMLVSMRWGFQPGWVKGAKRPAPINARAETLMERPLFRSALSHSRCIIPADGFYEWQTMPGHRTKQPIYARLRDGALFGFAGLYTEGHDAQGQPEANCAIITTAPNGLLAPIHNRMPVILAAQDEGLWLDPLVDEADPVLHCLRPYPAERMEAYPVSSLVSSAHNEGPDLIRPLASV